MVLDSRLWVMRRLALAGFVLLVVRLGQLQLVQGAAYRRLAEQNRLRLIPQRAPRGVIVDRFGRTLADNQTVFRVSAVPQELPRAADGPPGTRTRRTLFTMLAPLLDVSPDTLEERFIEKRGVPFLPAELVTRVPKPVALRVEEEHLALPGILVDTVTTRRYPMGTVAGHLLGYLSQPSEEVFPILKQYGVKPQDLVGRSGLEREFDAYLRGRSGGSMIEVNHRARQVRVMGRRDPVPGEPIVLTIDARLQALIEQRLGEQPGAAVVLRPSTGEVLAFVSTPVFDPQAFADQNKPAIRRMLDGPHSPMMNRAALGMYLPGSIVKIATAAIALEDQVITPQTTMVCPGYVEFSDRRIHCWNRDGHGPVRLHEALMGSCNVFFMDVGRRLGLERLRAGYQSIGFGRKTGWFLEEQPGHLPSRRLSEGEVALLAMGQGEILITPVQAAVMISAIANGGGVVEPWLVRSVGDHSMARTHLIPLGWAPDTIAAVREGLDAVVNDPHGTGIHARSTRIRVAGKTGTAQTGLQGPPHGWFVGMCPADSPIVALAVVAEHGGSGGDLPASIGKSICEYIADQPSGYPMQARE